MDHLFAAGLLTFCTSYGVAQTSNLEWMRCGLGQAWDGKICTGTPHKFTYAQALKEVAQLNLAASKGQPNNWRIPHIEEIASLIQCSEGFEDTLEIPRKLGGTKTVSYLCKGENHSKMKIDPAAFPNLADAGFGYWSSSLTDYKKNTYVVQFFNGNINRNKSALPPKDTVNFDFYSAHVLLVRSIGK